MVTCDAMTTKADKFTHSSRRISLKFTKEPVYYKPSMHSSWTKNRRFSQAWSTKVVKSTGINLQCNENLI